MGKASKDKRDVYYRLAKEQGWRARSAFKLLQLDEHFNLFEDVTRVVDLCAAPGSWSQVLSRVLVQGKKFDRVGVPDDQIQVAGPRSVDKAGDGGADDLVRDGQARCTSRASASATKHDEFASGSASANTDANDGGRDGIVTNGEEVNRNELSCNDVRPDTDARLVAVPDSSTNTGNYARTDRKEVKIVAIDLQPMNPLEGIIILQADITHPSTVPRLLAALDPDIYDLDYNHDPSGESINFAPISHTYHQYQHGDQSHHRHPVDLVLCDGAPDVTGLHDFDTYIQRELVQSALDLAICVLRPGGTFVAKIFRAKDVDLLFAQLRKFFESVNVGKPRSSRMSSVEAFVVCQGFRGYLARNNEPEMDKLSEIPRIVYDPTKGQVYPKLKKNSYSRRTVLENGIIELELDSPPSTDIDTGITLEVDANDHAEQRWTAPFISCGDPAAFDSDTTYALPKGYVSLDPVQPPTAPPYKMAIELRRAAGGAYGKTKHKNKTKPKMNKALGTEKG